MDNFETREFYVRMLALCSHLQKEHMANPNKFFRENEVREYAGDFLRPICKLLSEKVIYNVSYINIHQYNDISPNIQDLTPVIALCKEKIKEYDRTEELRLLDIDLKKTSILYSKFAIFAAGASIIISLLAIFL